MKIAHALSCQLLPRPDGCPIPLTATQTPAWNAIPDKSKPLSRSRLCADSIQILGPLNVAALEESLQLIAARHEALRTTIVQVSGSPLQQISPGDFHLSHADLRSTLTSHVDASTRQTAEEFLHKQIDLSAGPVFDAILLKRSDVEHIFIVAIDHIVSDATSWAILRDEVWRVYRKLLQHSSPDLPQLQLQFPDFAVWQGCTRDSWTEHHLPYWTQKLRAVAATRIPPDHRGSDVERPMAATQHILLGKTLTAKLRDFAQSSGAVFPLVVFTLYVAASSLRYGSRDLLIEFLSHGRNKHPALASMIGCLAHPTYLRLSIGYTDTLVDLLHQVTCEFLAAKEHDASHLVLPPENTPPTDFYFNWLPDAWSGADGRTTATSRYNDGLTYRPFSVPQSFPVKFSTLFFDSPSGLKMIVLYRADLFEPTTIQGFGCDLRWIATQLDRNPAARISSLTLPDRAKG